MTKTLTERFETYHENNPHIYEMFVEKTMFVINQGIKKIGAWVIIGEIRWLGIVVNRDGERYKISNDLTALYARKFQKDYPQFAYIFDTKQMKRA